MISAWLENVKEPRVNMWYLYKAGVEAIEYSHPKHLTLKMSKVHSANEGAAFIQILHELENA